VNVPKRGRNPGEHTLTARVTWPDGTVVQESTSYAVEAK